MSEEKTQSPPFDPGRPFKTRDGREVSALMQYRGKLQGNMMVQHTYEWNLDGTYWNPKCPHLDLVNTGAPASTNGDALARHLGAEVSLAECPVGLFYSQHDTLCLKTEYGDNGGRIDAYIVSTGELFWGGATNVASQRKVLVRPFEFDALAAQLKEAEDERDALRPLLRTAEDVVSAKAALVLELRELVAEADSNTFKWRQRADRAEAQLATARAALKPFAEAAEDAEGSAPSNRVCEELPTIGIHHFRAAVIALSAQPVVRESSGSEPVESADRCPDCNRPLPSPGLTNTCRCKPVESDGTLKPISSMSDEELIAEDQRLARLWDETQKGDGHSGSPGEWIYERSDEIATEQKHRARTPSPTGVTEAAVEAAALAFARDMHGRDVLEPRPAYLAAMPAALLAALPHMTEPVRRIRHKKRGTFYTVIAEEAQVQGDGPMFDYDKAAVYRGDDGKVWVRPTTEMTDGRFEDAPTPTTQDRGGAK